MKIPFSFFLLISVTLFMNPITVQGAVRGDLDGDGRVTVQDVVAQLKFTVESVYPTWIQFALGDLTGEGRIDVHDAVSNLRVAVGLQPSRNATPIIFDGNSLTRGCCAGDMNARNYPLQLVRSLGDSYISYNFSVVGQTTGEMLRDAAQEIDSLRRGRDRAAPEILVMWEGTNDLHYGASAQDAYERIARYASGRQKAGYKVIVLTLLPRHYENADSDFEARRQEVNALLRLNWREFADGIADVAADERIGDAGDELDTDYYEDGVHMTEEGYALIARTVREQLEPLLSTAE